MPDVKVRQANIDDSEDIFAWRNDTLTREMSRSSNSIRWEDHSLWYNKSLENINRILLICEDTDTGTKIGMVRFDFSEHRRQSEISINLSPKMRGSGYAKICLKQAVHYVQAQYPECRTIIAEIKKINIGSKRSFESAGFVIASEDEVFWQYHHVN